MGRDKINNAIVMIVIMIVVFVLIRLLLRMNGKRAGKLTTIEERNARLAPWARPAPIAVKQGTTSVKDGRIEPTVDDETKQAEVITPPSTMPRRPDFGDFLAAYHEAKTHPTPKQRIDNIFITIGTIGCMIPVIILALIVGFLGYSFINGLADYGKSLSPLNSSSIFHTKNYDKVHFCKAEAYILKTNMTDFTDGINMETFSPYHSFYVKSENVLHRFTLNTSKSSWENIEAKADIGILHSTERNLKASARTGSVNGGMLYLLAQRENLIISMDKSYCGNPKWWPKQFPTSGKKLLSES